jgi:hypothetical protein
VLPNGARRHGKTPAEIGGLPKDAAKVNGRDISEELLPSYDINDWLKVVKLVGGDWVLAENHEDKAFPERPTINEWMSNTMGPDLELAFCDDGARIGHVFAPIEQEVARRWPHGAAPPAKR